MGGDWSSVLPTLPNRATRDGPTETPEPRRLTEDSPHQHSHLRLWHTLTSKTRLYSRVAGTSPSGLWIFARVCILLEFKTNVNQTIWYHLKGEHRWQVRSRKAALSESHLFALKSLFDCSIVLFFSPHSLNQQNKCFCSFTCELFSFCF